MIYLAKQLAKADSGTCGPHNGSKPLHRVFAFWSAALSHSSLPLASLREVVKQQEIDKYSQHRTPPLKKREINFEPTSQQTYDIPHEQR